MGIYIKYFLHSIDVSFGGVGGGRVSSNLYKLFCLISCFISNNNFFLISCFLPVLCCLPFSSRFMLFSTVFFLNIEKCPFTYWLNGRWFLQIIYSEVKWKVVSPDSRYGQWESISNIFLHSLVLIFDPKYGGWCGGAKKTFLVEKLLSHFMLSSRFMLLTKFLEKKKILGEGCV